MKKAFILGAGLGTRLRPLTSNLPKPLVPVFNRPMVEFALDACIDAGIEKFAINIHHCPEAWEKAFPESCYRACSIDFFYEPTLLETGGGLKKIAKWIGADPILVHNGDIFSNIDITALILEHSNRSNEATLALRSSGPACVAEFDETTKQVVDLGNELKRGTGTHQFTGIYCLQPSLLERIPAEKIISVKPSLIAAAAENKLGGICLDEGHWVDLGTLDTYIEAHLENSSEDRIAKSAKLHPNAVLSPSSWAGAESMIGANCHLTDCIVWPRAKVPAGTHATKQVFQ